MESLIRCAETSSGASGPCPPCGEAKTAAEKEPSRRQWRIKRGLLFPVRGESLGGHIVMRQYDGASGLCVGAAACPRPEVKGLETRIGTANSYKATNSPHRFVLPPAGEDVSEADRGGRKTKVKERDTLVAGQDPSASAAPPLRMTPLPVPCCGQPGTSSSGEDGRGPAALQRKKHPEGFPSGCSANGSIVPRQARQKVGPLPL